MKVALLLSGGVDSSYALFRLLSQGNEVEAFYLKIWLEDDSAFLGECPWDQDIKYAQEVCDLFKVKLNIISLQREYYNKVVSYVLKELQNGYTPSPDIFCNQLIKFGTFFSKLESLGKNFDKVASGHYSKIIEESDRSFHLYQSPDKVKDQSYFLSFLSQKQLSKIIFPLQDLSKEDIREGAFKIGLPNKSRKDSQGICFLGKIKYSDFVSHYLKTQKGEIRDLKTDKILGEHNGFWFYTIGQRTGLKLNSGPWYVSKKDMDKNIVFVSHKDDFKSEDKDEFIISDLNFLSGNTLDFQKINKDDLKIKLRHGPKMIKSRIKKIQDDKYQIKMNEKDSGIAPGQFAVIYDKDECIAAGKISLENLF